jgi:GNAT superfamily N-acetyltransferase
VTCHYDVLDWLEPDWVLDMASGRLARGCLRRPPIPLEIAPIHRSAWLLFRRHHYLSGNLLTTVKCFAAFWGERPVAFSAWTHRMTRSRRPGDMREHRTVVLPDFQGVGIGNRLSEFCASLWTGLGGRAFSSTSHPSMIHYRSASPLWQRIRLSMVSPMGPSGLYGGMTHYPGNSCRRITAGFQYTGPALDAYEARRLSSVVPRPFI